MTPGQQLIEGASLWRDAWRRMAQNRMAMFGFVVFTLIILLNLLVDIVQAWLNPRTRLA